MTHHNGFKIIEEALQAASDSWQVGCPDVREAAEQALAVLSALKEAVHSDLPEIIEVAQKTGWQYESDLGIITTDAAKILNEFMGGDDD